MQPDQKLAVILLSGGIDSTTCLAIAGKQNFICYAISFSYGQRHHVEMQAAERVAAFFHVRDHVIVDIDLRKWGGSALTSDSLDVPEPGQYENIPPTYVPARNLIFLSFATAWAETLDARDIFIGVNSIDYSGYPDCRPQFIRAFNQCADLGTKAVDENWQFTIHTPLQDMNKAEIIKCGTALGVDYSITHSCYNPSEQGTACGKCDSCEFRRKGFRDANVPDPTRYQR